MNIDSLLARLKEIDVRVTEQEVSKGRALILECALPYPFARQHAWYPLILEEGQTDVPKHEVLAILRHLWHLGKVDDFFPEDAKEDNELEGLEQVD